jgi:hypothetical protein
MNTAAHCEQKQQRQGLVMTARCRDLSVMGKMHSGERDETRSPENLVFFIF